LNAYKKIIKKIANSHCLQAEREWLALFRVWKAAGSDLGPGAGTDRRD